MSRSLKARMKDRELTIGSWLSFDSPMLAEMMAKTGFDWLAIDMEHGFAGNAEMGYMIQVIDLAGCVPLVRVGGNDPLLIKRALDAGAHGVIVPMICSAEDAKAAVEAVYYPPVGKRGVGLSRAQSFGMDFDAYRESLSDHAVLIVQIEHTDAVHDLDAILAVDGVDGFIVGPYDMSGSINKPGMFDDVNVKTLLDEAAVKAAKHTKPGGYHIVHSDPAALTARIKTGCRFMAYGTEMIFLAEKLRDEGALVSKLKEETAR